MTVNDIESIIEDKKSICVSLGAEHEFPGYIRGVFIREGTRVVVEFEQYGFDEGGAYFYAEYDNILSIISDLEAYLGSSITNWRPISLDTDYPILAEPIDCNQGSTMLGNAITSRTVNLPKGAFYQLRGSNYWLQFDPSQNSV